MPDKCLNCPVLLNAHLQKEEATKLYEEAFEVCMGDFAEKRAKQESILAQQMGSDAEYHGYSEDEISAFIRKDIEASMNETEATIEELNGHMARFALNCDGVVLVSKTLGDGRKLEATICGSRENDKVSNLEVVNIQRTAVEQQNTY